MKNSSGNNSSTSESWEPLSWDSADSQLSRAEAVGDSTGARDTAGDSAASSAGNSTGSDLLLCGLALVAALFGFGLTWHAPVIAQFCASYTANSQITGLEQSTLCLTDSESKPSETSDNRAAASAQDTKFVQESLTRSSFRPDFSSGLRRANQRNNFTMLRAFSEAVTDARRSTVALYDETGQRVALGAIVDPDGWIATKASQLPAEGKLMALLADDTEWPAEIVQRASDVDIALLRVERAGLTAVNWASADIPLRGTWLATTDTDKMPSAVGVVAGVRDVGDRRQPTRN